MFLQVLYMTFLSFWIERGQFSKMKKIQKQRISITSLVKTWFSMLEIYLMTSTVSFFSIIKFWWWWLTMVTGWSYSRFDMRLEVEKLSKHLWKTSKQKGITVVNGCENCHSHLWKNLPLSCNVNRRKHGLLNKTKGSN